MSRTPVKVTGTVTKNNPQHFTDPVTGEKLAIGHPDPKEVDSPNQRKGTGLEAAKPEQLAGLVEKFAK